MGDQELLKERLTERVEDYFKGLFENSRQSFIELNVDSADFEGVKAIYKCFSNAVCRLFITDNFLPSDLSPTIRNWFDRRFVVNIFNQIIASSSVYPAEKSNIPWSEVTPFFFLIEYRFYTCAKKYIHDLIDGGFQHCATGAFQNADELVFSDHIFDSDEDFIPRKVVLSKTVRMKTSTEAKDTFRTVSKQSSTDDDFMTMPTFDMDKLIRDAQARSDLEFLPEAQEEEEEFIELFEVNTVIQEKDSTLETPTSVDDVPQTEDVVFENVDEHLISNIELAVPSSSNDISTLLKCDKISVLKPTPLLEEDDDYYGFVKNYTNQLPVFQRRANIKPISLIIPEENSLPLEEVVDELLVENLENVDEPTNEPDLSLNTNEDVHGPTASQSNDGENIQINESSESVQEEEKDDNDNNDKLADENTDMLAFSLSVPPMPNVDDPKPKRSKRNTEKLPNTVDESNKTHETTKVHHNDVTKTLEDSMFETDSGNEEDSTLMIVEEFLEPENVKLEVIDSDSRKLTEVGRSESRHEERDDSHDFEFEIKHNSNSLTSNESSDDIPKLTLKRRRSKSLFDSDCPDSDSSPSVENNKNGPRKKNKTIMLEGSDNEKPTNGEPEANGDDTKIDENPCNDHDSDSDGYIKKKIRSRKILDSDDGKSDDSDECSKTEAPESKDDNDIIISEEEDDVDDEKEGEPGPSKSKKKKRGRARRLSSDSSESEVSKKDKKKKVRRGARKIMDDSSLGLETLSAEKAEEERALRIAEKQKLYNSVLNCVIEESSLEKKRLVLDITKNKEVLVEVNESFLKFLKPHQSDGIKFMFDRTVETIDLLNSEPNTGSGAILAHSMGLGKTLQVVCFVHTIMTNPLSKSKFKRVLVIAPANVIKNWFEEFQKWVDPNLEEVQIFEMAKSSSLVKDRTRYLEQWTNEGGVMLITIKLYSTLLMNKKKKVVCDDKTNPYYRYLANPGPEMVIIDEGHLLKNDKSHINQAVSKIKTLRRIVLTGTPLQNNLSEYYVMVDFVKPRLLGTKQEFRNRFENPIKHGQHSDSSAADVHLMKKRSHILTRKLKDVIHRCDYRVLVPYLPPKNEYVIKVRLTDKQIELYQTYLSTFSSMDRTALFKDYIAFGYIWNHPLLLNNIDDPESVSSGSDINDFLDDSSPGSFEEDDDDDCMFLGSTGPSQNGEKKFIPASFVKQEGNEGETNFEIKAPEPPNITEWLKNNLREDVSIEEKIEQSTKFILLFEILNRCEAIGDKILVFSQSLKVLNLIESFLAETMSNFLEKNEGFVNLSYEQITARNNGVSNLWFENNDYLRIDGNSAIEKRMKTIKTFNDPGNTRSRLMLVSTKAGGIGINLYGANRCIIFDSSWNPANDLQAIFRIFRYGQTKPVYVYRFVACGTMEQKIYERQVLKQSLSHRVVDEKQIGRIFKSSDAKELYEFRCDYDAMRKPPKLPTDNLLAEVIVTRGDLIVDILEHDSLLENRPEEDLTEAERLQAWEEFHNPVRTEIEAPMATFQPIPSQSSQSSSHSVAPFHDNKNAYVYSQPSYNGNHQQSLLLNTPHPSPSGMRVVPTLGSNGNHVELPNNNLQYSNAGHYRFASQYQNYYRPAVNQNQMTQQTPNPSRYPSYNIQRPFMNGGQHVAGPSNGRSVGNVGYTPAISNPHVQTHQSLRNSFMTFVNTFDIPRLKSFFGNDGQEIESTLIRIFPPNINIGSYPNFMRTLAELFTRHINVLMNQLGKDDHPERPVLNQIVHNFGILHRKYNVQPETIMLD